MRPVVWGSILILARQVIKIVNNLSRGGLTPAPFRAVRHFFNLVKYMGRAVPTLLGAIKSLSIIFRAV